MIDVVIPTLLLSNPDVFKYTLKQLNESKVVGKIIIIDNTDAKRFRNEFKNFITDKFEIIEHGKNIFVNPAWNQGMEKVTSNYYLILNDDILCHKYLLNICNAYLNEEKNVGLITITTKNGMKTNVYDAEIQKVIEGKNDAKFNTKMPHNRQGWFMCGRTSDWKAIPDTIKIFYGDDFIYRELRKKKKKCVILSPYFISHFESTTVNTSNDRRKKEIKNVIKQDHIEWRKIS